MNFDLSDAVFIFFYTVMILGSYSGMELKLASSATCAYPFLFWIYRAQPALVGKNIIYLAGLWLVYSLLIRLKVIYQIDMANRLALSQHYKWKESAMKDSLEHTFADIKQLDEGYGKELDMFEIIRSMSRVMEFDAVFQVFAQKLKSVFEFKSCCFIMFKSDISNVFIPDKILRCPDTGTGIEAYIESITNLIFRNNCVEQSASFYTIYSFDKTGSTIYRMRNINNHIPVLVFNGLPDIYCDEIKPVLLPFYLEIRKSYLFENIRNLSIIDGLTGIYQRRHFINSITQELELSAEQNRNFAVLMMDIDDFKIYNDSYGHLAGDYILKEIGSIISGTIRSNDLAGRFGGEEFVFFLYETDITGALSMAHRLRKNIESHIFHVAGKKLKVTVSIGVSVYPADGTDAQTLIESADKKMYAAKTSGKNKVVSGSTPA